jgi:hypothetical protein
MGLAANLQSDTAHIPCIEDGLGTDAAQTLERLLLVITVIASGHIEELSRLVLEQRVSPVWPSGHQSP